MVPLTSVIKEEPYSVLVHQQDMQSGKLVTPSRIRVDKILCMQKSLIIMKIGPLKETVFKDVKEKVLKVF